MFVGAVVQQSPCRAVHVRTEDSLARDDGAKMPASFIQYEKANNKFIKALREAKEFRDIAETLVAEKVRVGCSRRE